MADINDYTAEELEIILAAKKLLNRGKERNAQANERRTAISPVPAQAQVGGNMAIDNAPPKHLTPIDPVEESTNNGVMNIREIIHALETKNQRQRFKERGWPRHLTPEGWERVYERTTDLILNQKVSFIRAWFTIRGSLIISPTHKPEYMDYLKRKGITLPKYALERHGLEKYYHNNKGRIHTLRTYVHQPIAKKNNEKTYDADNYYPYQGQKTGGPYMLRKTPPFATFTGKNAARISKANNISINEAVKYLAQVWNKAGKSIDLAEELLDKNEFIRSQKTKYDHEPVPIPAEPVKETSNPRNNEAMMFPPLDLIPQEYLPILRDMLANITHSTTNYLTYEMDGKMLGIANRPLWDAFLMDIARKADHISRALGVPNRFKITMRDGHNILRYGM